MESSLNLTEAEVLEELRRALEKQPSPDGAMTVKEIMRELSLSKESARALVGEQIEAGKMECVRVYRKGIDRMSKVPAYRWVG
jgi:predicted DNA-binding transcriptional regulator